jgi:hypothetical protein
MSSIKVLGNTRKLPFTSTCRVTELVRLVRCEIFHILIDLSTILLKLPFASFT